MARWRRCVCGTKIVWGHTLCAECLRTYGARADKWPAWLRFWINDTQRELEAERDHHEQSLDDDWHDHIDDRYPSEYSNDVGASWRYILDVML